jgi:hypothetical protein
MTPFAGEFVLNNKRFMYKVFRLVVLSSPASLFRRIPRSRDCVPIALKCKFVILNEVKNLIRSMCCKTEILRLGPQNDIATQSPSRAMTD